MLRHRGRITFIDMLIHVIIIPLGIFSTELCAQCTYSVVLDLRWFLYRIETLDKPAPRKQYGFHFFFQGDALARDRFYSNEM